MRLFIAATLPEKALDQLVKAQDQLKAKCSRGNLTARENLHITVKFLGEVYQDKLDLLYPLMDELTRFDAAQGEVKQISTLKAANIVCAKMKFDDNMYRMEEYLTKRLEENNFNVEHRTYTPHVTLMRKYSFDAPFSEVVKTVDCPKESFFVDSLSLFSSVLEPKGPVYTEIYRIQLKK